MYIFCNFIQLTDSPNLIHLAMKKTGWPWMWLFQFPSRLSLELASTFSFIFPRLSTVLICEINAPRGRGVITANCTPSPVNLQCKTLQMNFAALKQSFDLCN